MECSYDELTEKNKTEAMKNVGSMLQSRLGLWKALGTSYFVSRPLVECVIKELDTVFDEKGKIRFNSKKYEVTADELFKKVVEQCQQ